LKSRTVGAQLGGVETCRVVDLVQNLDDRVEREGDMVDDPKWDCVFRTPALVDSRLRHIVLARLLVSLRLPEEHAERPERKALRGVHPMSAPKRGSVGGSRLKNAPTGPLPDLSSPPLALCCTPGTPAWRRLWAIRCHRVRHRGSSHGSVCAPPGSDHRATSASQLWGLLAAPFQHGHASACAPGPARLFRRAARVAHVARGRRIEATMPVAPSSVVSSWLSSLSRLTAPDPSCLPLYLQTC
jgi:hypothetical protein